MDEETVSKRLNNLSQMTQLVRGIAGIQNPNMPDSKATAFLTCWQIFTVILNCAAHIHMQLKTVLDFRKWKMETCNCDLTKLFHK